jgi:hypothetical protein
LEVAKEKLGAGAEFRLNADKTFVLCRNRVEATGASPLGSVAYFVYDLKADEVVHDGTLHGGSVRWLNNYQLKLTEVPGTVKAYSDGPVIHIFDLKLGKRLASPPDQKR